MSRLRPRLTFSNVVSLIALFVALGGGAYAAVKLKPNQVKSKNIAPDAVQGVDANESSFGTVPRAAQSDNAAHAASADNAASLDGFTAGEFQGGDGFDKAVAGFVDNGVTGGILDFEGAIGVACSAAPKIIYEDFGPDAFDTDLWVDGTHTLVSDEGSAGPFDLNPGPDQGTAQVHIWGGAGVIADVVASAVWDAVNTRCTLAFTSQENLNSAASAAAASARAKGDLSRGRLPDGWVTPSRTP